MLFDGSVLLEFQPLQGRLAPRFGNKIAALLGFWAREDAGDDKQFHVTQVFQGEMVIFVVVVVVVERSSTCSSSARIGRSTVGGGLERLGRWTATTSTTESTTAIGEGLLIKSGSQTVGIHVLGRVLHNLVNEVAIRVVHAGLVDIYQVVGSQIGQNVDLEVDRQCRY